MTRRDEQLALGTRVIGGQPGTLQAVFVGLVFSQVSLLGIWAGSASNSRYVRLAGAAVGDDLGIMALIYLPFVVIGLLSVWPALSARRPLLPCSIFIAVAVGVGMCFGHFGFPMNTPYWIAITSLEALSLVASLLVVWSCGYRLVRLARRATEESGVA